MKHLFLLILLFSNIYSNGQAPLKMAQSNWQQRVDYTISATLNDIEHTLSASEKIIYTNNSPNEIKEIYMHLWPNAYKNDETAFAKQKLENGETDFYYSQEEDKGWIDSLNFKVNEQQVKWYLLDDIDICKIELNQPLMPGGQIEITTPFKVKLPKVFSRMGHDGQTYCITQWYPKPAVYDVNGWNDFPYLNQGEFYSEFGAFDVSISVPKNYVVAATGNLQNVEEYQWLLERSKNRFSKENSCLGNTNPLSEKEYKTLRYVQDSIHDFAWFCDKRFAVERSEVNLPKSGRKITAWFFEICPKKTSVHWVDTAILYYSRMIGEYPYQNVSAVVTPLSAGGGMEYPTITNITSASRDVIVHEIGHNWFYGILANNERMYPWMDESFNNYYETRSAYNKEPATHKGLRANFGKKSGQRSSASSIGETSFGLLQFEYLLSSRKNLDQPVCIPSAAFENKNYGMIIYGKGPLIFHHLQAYLGDDVFDAMMQSYYEKWKFKHPLPYDFINHAKQFTGKNLNWFFTDLMNANAKPDYKIVSVKRDAVTIKNKSTATTPFPISGMVKGDVISTQWVEGFLGKKAILLEDKQAEKLRIDAYETTLDVYRNNNTARTKGIFKTIQPIQFQFIGDLENPYKTQIFYTPIVGANLYNKTMVGMAFYNGLIPQKKVDFVLTPMYSFGTKDITGYVQLEKHFTTDGVFRQIHVGVNGARFGYEYFSNAVTYNKVSPFIRFDLNKLNKRSAINQTIQARSIFLLFNKNKNSSDASYAIVPINTQITEINYLLENKKAINGNKLSATIQNINSNGNYTKAFLEFKQTINYDKPKKKLDLRLFGGTFLSTDDNMPGEYQFKMSGNIGQFDYLFDQALMGRSENSLKNGVFTRQIIDREGNMHMPTANTSTNSWVFSANLVSTIPGPIPIRIFADLGYINSSSYSPQTGMTKYEPTLQYVAGLKLVIMEDVCDINFPLFYSDDFETALKTANANYETASAFERLAQRITFTLNLNKLNPIKGIRNYSF